MKTKSKSFLLKFSESEGAGKMLTF